MKLPKCHPWTVILLLFAILFAVSSLIDHPKATALEDILLVVFGADCARRFLTTINESIF